MRQIQAYVPKERILPSREIVKEGQALWDLRVQAPFGAVGIGTGTWAVLFSIPEG